MPFTPDHSANFPSEFKRCPRCGKKGYYHIDSSQTITGVDGTRGLIRFHFDRCKYCGYYERLSA